MYECRNEGRSGRRRNGSALQNVEGAGSNVALIQGAVVEKQAVSYSVRCARWCMGTVQVEGHMGGKNRVNVGCPPVALVCS